MYYLPEPPYFLMFVGFFTGITCGVAFEATLKQIVNTWYKSSAKPADLLDSSTLQLPFLGICVGICVFLASGVEIFLMNRWVSYAISLPMTIFIGALVWTQLGKLLEQLQKGGSKAIDLDAFF
ncbi:hypothetical protein C7H19_01255 [Aphanothece hegewaldii CCALA 016]|uniref:Uncharacterized protein n=1 Tax=Aphanothece hegewaldii CCALA 016 TaxID=2107694 RepID=A0A2T1M3M5_9CHRO|nr:hypothetical protein [Aphanothece hegewaldii]PSF39444.1 hypothetical protein C7H19_01255 [Aphanothece hegewaldii CCALA 016]